LAGGLGVCILADSGRSAPRSGARGGASMMAVFILACSIIFLLQFFISYCRSLIASSVREPISQEVQEVTGMARPAAEEEFARVVQLLQLCQIGRASCR